MSTLLNKANMLSSEEIRAVIENLNDSDWIRLVKLSRIHALRKSHHMGGFEPEGLLQEAFLRALNGQRKCRSDLDFIQFMSGAMRSIANSSLKTQKKSNTVVVDFQSTQPGSGSLQIEDEESKLVRRNHFEVLYSRLLELFESDELAQVIIEGDIEGLSKDELMELTQLDPTSFASKRKAIRRKIIREYKGERNEE